MNFILTLPIIHFILDAENMNTAVEVTALLYCPQLAMLFIGYKSGLIEAWDLKKMSLE